MRDTFRATALLLLFPSLLVAEDATLDQVRALEKTVRGVIRKAESGVASIVISRSGAYAKYDRNLGTKKPGELGGFDPDHFAPRFPRQDEEAEKVFALDLSDPNNVPEQFGSAIVLDDSGRLLTPAHLVTGATKIFARLPGGDGGYCNILALDPRSDLAVLKLIRPIPDLDPIPLGDGDALEKGRFVVSIANPFAVGFADGSPSASTGIISNLRRRLPGRTSETERTELSLHHFGTLIQTDCRINAGCSGGALLNLKGELIGIISSQAGLTGLDSPGGFALPVNDGLKRVVSVLKAGREVEYGFLGVQFGRTGTGLARLSNVIPGSPAERGGLRAGDFILAVGENEVKSTDDLFLALAMYTAGSTVKVTRARALNGPREVREIILGKFHLPRPMIASVQPEPRAGLRVDYPTTLVRDTWPRGQSIPRGVRVREVVPKSPADKVGLREDDVIFEVDGTTVTTPEEFRKAMDRANGFVNLTVSDHQGERRIERISLR